MALGRGGGFPRPVCPSKPTEAGGWWAGSHPPEVGGSGGVQSLQRGHPMPHAWAGLAPAAAGGAARIAPPPLRPQPLLRNHIFSLHFPHYADFWAAPGSHGPTASPTAPPSAPRPHRQPHGPTTSPTAPQPAPRPRCQRHGPSTSPTAPPPAPRPHRQPHTLPAQCFWGAAEAGWEQGGGWGSTPPPRIMGLKTKRGRDLGIAHQNKGPGGPGCTERRRTWRFGSRRAGPPWQMGV